MITVCLWVSLCTPTQAQRAFWLNHQNVCERLCMCVCFFVCMYTVLQCDACWCNLMKKRHSSRDNQSFHVDMTDIMFKPQLVFLTSKCWDICTGMIELYGDCNMWTFCIVTFWHKQCLLYTRFADLFPRPQYEIRDNNITRNFNFDSV